MRKIKHPDTLNALTEEQKIALEKRGYRVRFKYLIRDPITGEIIEEGWEMKLKEVTK